MLHESTEVFVSKMFYHDAERLTWNPMSACGTEALWRMIILGSVSLYLCATRVCGCIALDNKLLSRLEISGTRSWWKSRSEGHLSEHLDCEVISVDCVLLGGITWHQIVHQRNIFEFTRCFTKVIISWGVTDPCLIWWIHRMLYESTVNHSKVTDIVVRWVANRKSNTPSTGSSSTTLASEKSKTKRSPAGRDQWDKLAVQLCARGKELKLW